MSKLFEISNNFGLDNQDTLSTEEIIENGNLYAEIMQDYLNIEEDKNTIDSAYSVLNKLEQEVSVEEKYIDTNNIGVYESSLSGYYTALEEIGLSAETSNSPSTDVEKDPDLRQAVDNKKSLIKKIVEGIKKMFEKLYKKALTLWAKIKKFLNFTNKKLNNALITISKGKGTLLEPKSALPIMTKIGFYYVLNKRSFDANLLKDMVNDDKFIIANLFKDLETIHSAKTVDFDKLLKEIEIKPGNELSPGSFKNQELAGIVDALKDQVKSNKIEVKDIMDGVIIKLSGTGAVISYINSSDNKDPKSILTTRKVEHAKFKLDYGTSLKGEILTVTNQYGFKMTIKNIKTESDIIPGIKDMIKFINSYDSENDKMDKTISKYKKTYDELEKGVVGEYADVLKNSLMLFNKLIFEITTTKRLAISSIVNNYADAVKLASTYTVEN